MRQAGATLHRGAWASHYRGLSCCGAQAPNTQAQSFLLMGLVAPRHVGSSQTRARTRVPCIGRQILNHCTTREAPVHCFLRHHASAHSINYYSVNINLICTGNQKICVTSLYCNIHFIVVLWNGTCGISKVQVCLYRA